MKKIGQWGLLQNSAKRIALIVVVAAFSGLGVHLLQSSKAEPADGATPSPLLSLAPASLRVAKGGIVNMAVNIDTGTAQAGSAKAIIRYPASLELQAVRDVCLAPAFAGVEDSSSAVGTVTVACQTNTSAPTKSVMAMLVFKVLDDTGTANVQIDDDSRVTQNITGTALSGVIAGSELSFGSLQDVQRSPRRQAPTYQVTQDLCAALPVDQPRCFSVGATNDEGTVYPNGHGKVEAVGPFDLHFGYQVPCTPGGPTADVCAQPSSFGPTIGLIVSGNYQTGVSGLESDLAQYTQFYGEPSCTAANGCLKVVNSTGGSALPAAAGDSWNYEIMLDVVSAHVMCQTCKILLVESAANWEDTSTANNYAATHGVIATSNSWGTDRNVNYNSHNADFDHPGVAQFAATGDNGAINMSQTVWPASLPGVIAVSGTTLVTNDDYTWNQETVWSGSGGGCSGDYGASSWQKNLPNWSSVGCNTWRAFGDMSLDADPNSGVVMYVNGKWIQYGGTSLASPLAAALFALTNKSVPAGVVAPSVLYANANSNNTHDIVSGNDCSTSATTTCTAHAGFDVPSGLGTPRGLGLFGGPTPPPPPAPPTPPPTTPPPTTPPPTTPPPTTPPPTTPPPTTPPPTTPPPTTPPPTTPVKTGDLNGDNKVNITDLSILLSAWNTSSSTADLNRDGKVNITDLSILLSHWGT